jgi:hypothetical protein
MSALERLQRWYASQCDGDWEHSFGLALETLDNPGWALTVDLKDTELLLRPFAAINRGVPGADADWLICKVENTQFIGSGGVHNLEELLQTFLEWAKT